jgi:glycosyltransferase involved in cell wall biosynthesis
MHVVMAGVYPADPGKISGGVEAVVLYLTQALQSYPDLTLDVVTIGRRGTARRTVQHGDVTVHYLPCSRLPSHLSALANMRQVRTEMRRLKPDLIHVQVAGELAEAAAGTGLPWVLTLHGIRFMEVALWQGFLNKVYRGWFVKRAERRAVKRAKHIISISPFIQSTFKGQIRGAIYNIENPIDDVFFNVPQKRNPGQLLFVGRLTPLKGVHTLLHAFAYLHRRMPEATLRLAGGDHYRSISKAYPQELRRFVADAGLEGAVTFLGALDRPNLLKEYSNCSALVLSSVQETAPMVIMEAMAAGKAVVSTDAGGARYLVEHGQTGLIVPPNDERALGEALYQVLSDEAKLEAMGRRAADVARQRFHAKAVAAQTREVYYNILGRLPPHCGD